MSNVVRKQNEKGVAMVMTLMLILVASTMAVSLVYVSRSEAFASMNYRLMSQSRDAAEAGVNAAANYIVNTYTKPGGTGNPMSNYVRTGSPVKYNGSAVVLSASGKAHSNYPVAADQTAFNSAAQGTVTAGFTTVTYAASAQMLNMSQIQPFGSSGNSTIQTWMITSDGSVSGIQNSDVEVSTVLEQQATPVFTYAAFADSNGCSALTFGGGGTTDSYDDTAALHAGEPVTSAISGNVGTNGNLGTNGSKTTINGTLSSPRTGVGSCTTNNVTAWTDTTGTVNGPPGCNGVLSCALVELPQPVNYPLPTIPADGTTDLDTKSSCPSGLTGCSTSGKDMTLNPGGGSVALRNITIDGGSTLHLGAGTYNINTLLENGSGNIVLDSTPVIINVTGTGGGTVFDITGGGLANTSGNFDATTFEVLYAGSGTINLKGGGNGVGLIYAPLASYSFGGGGDWYGSVVGATLTDMGGAAIHYDRRLKTKAMMVGNYTLGSYTWKKF